MQTKTTKNEKEPTTNKNNKIKHKTTIKKNPQKNNNHISKLKRNNWEVKTKK